METYTDIGEELLSFLDRSPTGFHAVTNLERMLSDASFTKLEEDQRWNLTSGGKYFVTRNGSALIGFVLPEKDVAGFRIVASHSDSPGFKIKENPEMCVEDQYVKLNVEGYGGMILSSWLDRPLSVAGRIIIKERNTLVSKLVQIDRDLLLIPNLAIHMNRQLNQGYTYNKQKDMLPLFGGIDSKGKLFELIKEENGITGEIMGHDLYLYNRQKGAIFGAHGEFISSGRLDDLQCVFSSVKGFLQGEKKKHISVFCVLDNEEVGSGTRQGAASTFLKDTLERINFSLGGDEEDYRVHVAKSFMISADNAHAVHPNHMDKADSTNRVYLNGGVVLKMNAEQKYCTDGISAAVLKDLCREAGVPLQTFVNRSDMAGGSTLGNISTTQVALCAVDAGLPQLAMHSAYETAGIKDTAYFAALIEKFYS